MTTTVGKTSYTPTDVARLSDETGKLYELVDGVLVEKHVSGRSNFVAGRIVYFLNAAYPPDKAYVFVEQPTYCFPDPNKMRRPDVGLVWAERLPGGPSDEELFIAPDLVVEVVSPTNKYDDLLERIEAYLDAGVPLCWIAAPARRTIHVYRKDGTVDRYRADALIENEPLLPGFRLKVADCFMPVPAVKPI